MIDNEGLRAERSCQVERGLKENAMYIEGDRCLRTESDAKLKGDAISLLKRSKGHPIDVVLISAAPKLPLSDQ